MSEPVGRHVSTPRGDKGGKGNVGSTAHARGELGLRVACGCILAVAATAKPGSVLQNKGCSIATSRSAEQTILRPQTAADHRNKAGYRQS